MADQVKKMSYCYLNLPNRAGQGDRVLGALERAGINLLAFTAFPGDRGTAQIDLILDRLGPLQRVARKNGWRLTKAKRGFLVQGQDKVGALHRQVHKLAKQKINITAAS